MTVGDCANCANHYGVPSTMPPDHPSRRVDVVDLEDLMTKASNGPLSFCRCYASKKFPYCDGSHHKHNSANGDNAGPVVFKAGLDDTGKAAFLVSAERSEDEKKKDEGSKRANNYGVVSNAPAGSAVRRVDVADAAAIQAMVREKGVVALCRCYKSSKFPFCDGAHNKHNKETGDNTGPLLVKHNAANVLLQPVNTTGLPQLSLAEVAKHNTAEDMWVIIHGKVYDVTSFLPDHPGGIAILKQYAGKIADEGFNGVHAEAVIAENIPKEKCMGLVPATSTSASVEVKRPPIDSCLNLYDFEAVAKHVLKLTAFNYYYTASTDEFTKNGNQAIYRRIKLKPRVMVDVSELKMNTTMLGVPLDFPVYISGAAKCGFAHPDAEVALCKAANTMKVVQMCPHMSTKPHEEMAEARAPGQVQFLQLYMEKDREASKRTVMNAEKLGFQAIFVTVDSAGIGKRETDLRTTPGGSAPRSAVTSRRWADDMTWKDIPWLRSFTSMKIVLKGVQTGEDAVKALHAGVEGIVVSNHGGRNCDTARPTLEALVEIMAALRADSKYDKAKFEVYVDGGIYRGSDVYKAIALGATAVGIGRAALFGLAAYGQDGVERTLEVLRNELFVVMQMMGKASLADVGPDSISGVQEAIAGASWDTSRSNLTTISFDNL